MTPCALSLVPESKDHLPILSGIQPAKLRLLESTLSLAKRGNLNPDHILHGQLAGLPDVPQERLKSKRSFVPAVRKLFNPLTETGPYMTHDYWLLGHYDVITTFENPLFSHCYHQLCNGFKFYHLESYDL